MLLASAEAERGPLGFGFTSLVDELDGADDDELFWELDLVDCCGFDFWEDDELSSFDLFAAFDDVLSFCSKSFRILLSTSEPAYMSAFSKWSKGKEEVCEDDDVVDSFA